VRAGTEADAKQAMKDWWTDNFETPLTQQDATHSIDALKVFPKCTVRL
jgi:hypothetical protein